MGANGAWMRQPPMFKDYQRCRAALGKTIAVVCCVLLWACSPLHPAAYDNYVGQPKPGEAAPAPAPGIQPKAGPSAPGHETQ